MRSAPCVKDISISGFPGEKRGEDRQWWPYLVEHASQNLSSHDETARFRIDLDVSGDDADFGGIERLLEVAEFLVRERFDRRRVDGAGHVLLGESDRVLGYDRLACRGVCGDEDRVAHFHVIDGFLLERVELERVL